MMNSYKEIVNKEKKAKLLGILTAKTQGMLNKEHIEKIIESIDIDLKYTIKVECDIKKVADELKLRDVESSEMGISEGVEEVADTVIGNIKYGRIKSNINEQEVVEPDFDISKEFAVIKHVHSWKTGERVEAIGSYDTRSNYIIIYIPTGKEYKFDRNIDFILRNFNIK